VQARLTTKAERNKQAAYRLSIK